MDDRPNPHRRRKVVLIGRPNVGKSTLFNRLVGRRIALVDDTPGVTRDRREGDASLFDLDFIVVDTAGLEEADAESLAGRMRRQTEAAVADAAVVLMMVDARAGVTPLDRAFAGWLRTQPVPAVLVANKAEGAAGEAGVLEAYSLGFDEPVAISAEHGEGLADLFQAIAPFLDVEEEADAPADTPLKLAIVGRPNAGKSTLINRLLDEDRLVTGPEAGITRDSIAIPWSWRGRDVRLIDTAGVRRRSKVQEKLEKLSVADTKRAVDFAEVVVLLLDGTLGLEAQDLRIADMVLNEGRALIVAINKWDAANDLSRTYQGISKALGDGLSQVKGVSLIPVSGLTGKGLDLLLDAAFELRDIWSQRVSTAKLNRWFEEAQSANPPPSPKGKHIRLRYITQARTRPPTFVIFGNRLEMLPASYVRYLTNSLRDSFDFKGVPIRMTLRSPKNPYA